MFRVVGPEHDPAPRSQHRTPTRVQEPERRKEAGPRLQRRLLGSSSPRTPASGRDCTPNAAAETSPRPGILSCKELTVELLKQEELHEKKRQSQSPLYARIMQTPLATPVPVLRLPRGPDGSNRGFAPDGRRAPPKPEVPEPPESRESREQQARASLRERYLRSLLAMVGRPVCFTLHEGVQVIAHFGATDLDVANFYVSQLQTPIGVQAEALLRCSDIISYTFKP
uniref:Gem-associated protein 7 n=3 Tax=Bovinae TaxID=27592 RepID=A0A8B9YTS6_BOSMU